MQLFDDGALKPLKPLMTPVLDVIRTSPTGIYVAYGLVMTPVLLIIMMVLLLSKQVRACLPVLCMYIKCVTLYKRWLCRVPAVSQQLLEGRCLHREGRCCLVVVLMGMFVHNDAIRHLPAPCRSPPRTPVANPRSKMCPLLTTTCPRRRRRRRQLRWQWRRRRRRRLTRMLP